MLSTDSFAKAGARWVSVGSIDQINLGQGRCFVIGSRRVAFFRLRSGKVYALDAVCPHRGGPLAEGVAGSETVVCPLHGFKFSLVDGRGLDNDLAVRAYPIEVRDGDLFVRLPEPA